jgi:hypothetical protein
MGWQICDQLRSNIDSILLYLHLNFIELPINMIFIENAESIASLWRQREDLMYTSACKAGTVPVAVKSSSIVY